MEISGVLSKEWAFMQVLEQMGRIADGSDEARQPDPMGQVFSITGGYK